MVKSMILGWESQRTQLLLPGIHLPTLVLEHAIATWPTDKMMASMAFGGIRKKSLTLRGVDPETCMIVFKNHWAQVNNSSPICPLFFLIFISLFHTSINKPITVFLSCGSAWVRSVRPIFLIMVGRQLCACVRGDYWPRLWPLNTGSIYNKSLSLWPPRKAAHTQSMSPLKRCVLCTFMFAAVCRPFLRQLKPGQLTSFMHSLLADSELLSTAS